MPEEKCLLFRESLAAYILNALEADEARSVEAHLRSCAECQKVLEQYQAIGDGLAMTVTPRNPPPRVRARLIAQLAARKPIKADSTRRVSIWQTLTGLALAISLAINAFTLWQLTQVQRQQITLQEQLRANQRAMSVVAYPGGRALPIKSDQVSGTLVMNAEIKSGVLIVHGLASLEPSRVYQAWLIKPDGGRISAGVFQAESGVTVFVIASPDPLSEFIGVGVTVEPAGGSPAPTGPRILGVNF